jgi:Repeat of unknown function (DUF6923)/PEP-CTERM motif
MAANRCVLAVAVALLFSGVSVIADPILWGVDPNQNDYYQVDPNDGHFISTQTTTMSGFTVNGLNAVTIDTTTGTFYVIAKVSGGPRRLGTFDPATGVITDIGSLGDNFSSLTFSPTGQLYGVTGDGANVPETLYTIDKATAATTFFQTLGDGADGEVIAFNPVDGLIYHWSGNGTIVFESVDPNTHTVTIIPQSGVQDGEIFGAVWSPGAGNFLISNIEDELLTQTTSGDVTLLGSGSANFRGLALQDTPEPASVALAGIGLGVLAWFRSRRLKRTV